MSTPSDGRVPKRPRPVTTGGIIAIVSSSLLLLELADSLSTLHTTATRENIQEFLSKPPGDGFDVTVAQFTEVIRWYALVSGALGAMALVFAVFVLKRHRGARIGLTVAAGLLLLTMPLTGLAPIFVAIAAVLVWTRPGRDWYSGRTHMEAFQTPPPLPLMTEQGPPPSPYPFGTPPGEGAPSWPPAQPPDAAEPTAPMPSPAYPPYPGYSGYPVGYPGFGYPYAAGSRDPNQRPWTVTTAAVLTWIGAGATAVLMLLFVLVLAAGADSFVTEFDTAARDSDLTLTREQILAVGWAVAAVFLFWSVVSIVLAVLVVRRSNGARIALVISSGMTVVVSLIAIMSGISAITLLLGIAAGVLLFTGGANEWYRNRGNAVQGAGYRPPFGPPPGGSPIPGPAYWPTPGTPPPPPPAAPPTPASGPPAAEGGPDPAQAPPPLPPPPPTERPKPW